MELSDKVIIVTGAARGLGQTYARRFAEMGNRLVVCDMRDSWRRGHRLRD